MRKFDRQAEHYPGIDHLKIIIGIVNEPINICSGREVLRMGALG